MTFNKVTKQFFSYFLKIDVSENENYVCFINSKRNLELELTIYLSFGTNYA